MRIKVGPVVWEVRDSVGSEDFGSTEYMGGIIYVNPSQSASQMAETLTHELLHAAGFTFGIDMGGPEKEEELIKTLSPVLLGILRDNDDLVHMLVGDLPITGRS